MSVKIIAGIAGVVVFLILVILIYNKFVRLRYAVKTAWSDIDVHLKKRYELLPNLVETVKGYTKHENETLSKVIEMRAMAMNAKGVQAKAAADNALTGMLKNLFALVESYPRLKADAHYLEIMTQIRNVEDNIEYARRYYNSVVNDYNVAIAVFPQNIVASAFLFGAEVFFTLDDEVAERKPVKISFT